MLVALMF